MTMSGTKRLGKKEWELLKLCYLTDLAAAHYMKNRKFASAEFLRKDGEKLFRGFRREFETRPLADQWEFVARLKESLAEVKDMIEGVAQRRAVQ